MSGSKMRVGLVMCVVVALGLAIVIRAYAGEKVAGGDTAGMQRVVYLWASSSLPMEGDTIAGCSGKNAMPVLLGQGWRVKSITIVACQGDGDGNPKGYALLER
jgi:hypothetical protein